jgi:D-3-phosphoglycerate dehydrogenase
MFKVFITDHTFQDTAPEREVLKNLAEVVELRGTPTGSEEEVIRACQGADALIIGFAPVTAKVLDALPGLRCIVRYGIGCDTIDVKAAADRGVPVANVPDYCISEVADHTLALLLALERKIFTFDASLRRGEWTPVKTGRPLHRLAGRVLGIIGMGRIGTEVALRARAFGYRILVYDAFIDEETARARGTEKVGLDTLLAQSDVVSLHLPLTEETRHLLNERTLAGMKRGAYLINVSRGAVVDTYALAEALHAGHLGGAALDVYEAEPLPADHPMRSAPNTILQPHGAWYSEESLRELQRNAAEEVARVLRGGKMKNIVNVLC